MEGRRIEALADGVFAIAMTLLVLDLHVPLLPATVSPDQLAGALLQSWPRFVSYAGGFLILGMLWIGHHNHFHYVRRADRTFLWINIGYLACIGFLPYCTALLGSFPTNRTAAVVYGIALMLAGSALYGEWVYAARRGLLRAEATPHIVRAQGRRILVGLAGYAIAVMAAFANVPLSLALYVLFPLLYIRPATLDRHLVADAAQHRAL